MPPGVPFIVVNEAAERFSYYGMRAILVIFMTQYLLDSSGVLAPMKDTEAKQTYHLFTLSAYFFPLLGGILADAFWGKYRTIIALSLVYCLGHLALALNETRTGLLIGLGLIALGSGGIKSCVSAHVGDQFGRNNKRLLSRVFNWFYWSINLGAFLSQFAIPTLLEKFGPGVAFGLPGVLMALATLVFWIGRNRYVHIPPRGAGFVREAFSREGLTVLSKLAFGIYIFVAMFWSLFDQTGSAWVLQAQHMDRTVFGFDILPSQIQAVNPVMVLSFIPIFTYFLYPALSRLIRLTAVRKISIGLFVAVLSFLVSAYVEWRIELGESPTILWQVLGYALITAAEVMVSITALELSYTQAPRKMKSLVMGVYLLSVTLGNAFAWLFNLLIEDEAGGSRISGVSYYLFFSGAMLLTALAFLPVAARFKERVYIQGEDEEAGEPAAQEDALPA